MLTGRIRIWTAGVQNVDKATRSWSKARSSGFFLTRTAQLSTITATENSGDNVTVKPFSEMPAPKGLPLLGTLFQQPKDPTKQLPFLKERCEQYFPIYKEKFLHITFVSFYDMKEVENFLRTEAKYPKRFDLTPWKHYRKISGEKHAVLTSDGEDWHRMRRVVDKPMLRIKEVSSYADSVNEVVEDFLSRLHNIRETDGLVPDLENELFNWSLESIGKVLYERRFGGLSDERNAEMQEFIDCIRPLFEVSIKLFTSPMWFSKTFLRSDYKRHNHYWDILFRVAKKCVDERKSEIEKSREKGDENPAGALSYLLSDNTLPLEEIYSNITELMMGAVDTTSTAMLWILHELALNPQVQDKLLAEVESVVPGDRQPSYKDLQNMPYLKAVIKEGFRLYPTSAGVSRALQEDKVICGYRVPAKSIVVIHTAVLNRLPQYFDDPLVFRPERWLRGNEDRPNPIFQLAFGYGTRMCIGRRVAELELNMLISQLIRRFSIEPGFTERAKESIQLILSPDRPLKIKLIDRK